MKLSNLENHGVSVVIVTYNGANKIKPTLEHLANQKGINFEWEVILVDNNSTDNTGKYAEEIWKNCGEVCPLKVIKEKKPGTMYARKNGIINSSYRYMLFCDDDNWLAEHYVKTAYEQIHKKNDIAAVGGKGVMEFEDNFTIPEWIHRHAGKFGVGPQGKENEDVKSLYTAGTIFDRVWLAKLYSAGFQSMLRGRDGKSLIAGEDTELTYGLNLIGGKLRYCQSMQFLHFMPSTRINWRYLLKLSKAMEQGAYLLKPYKNNYMHRNILIEYLVTSAFIVKYFAKSIVHGFSEGEDSVVHLHMFLGRFQVLKNSRKNHRKAEKIICELLASKEVNN